MVMVQSDDFGADRARVEGLGIRIVWSAELPDISGMHLHPRDTGGPLLSLDQPLPPESWRWAGPEWRDHVRTERVRAIAGADMACAEPAATARRWSELLDLPAHPEGDGWRIDLAPGLLRFVPDRAGRGDFLVGVHLDAPDPAPILEAARARDLPTTAHTLTLCGTRFHL